jgi:hypothetical protein
MTRAVLLVRRNTRASVWRCGGRDLHGSGEAGPPLRARTGDRGFLRAAATEGRGNVGAQCSRFCCSFGVSFFLRVRLFPARVLDSGGRLQRELAASAIATQPSAGTAVSWTTTKPGATRAWTRREHRASTGRLGACRPVRKLRPSAAPSSRGPWHRRRRLPAARRSLTLPPHRGVVSAPIDPFWIPMGWRDRQRE